MANTMTKVYVQLRKCNGFGNSDPAIELNLEKSESNDTFAYGDICEIEVALPILTDEDKEKIMCGAELDSLIKMKERLNAETHRKLMQINDRIEQLQAIEDKSEA